MLSLKVAIYFNVHVTIRTCTTSAVELVRADFSCLVLVIPCAVLILLLASACGLFA